MEIGGMVGKVSKLDFNTDSKDRGRYARMVVFVDLGRPLISKILINDNPQRIEYENLLVVCFKCGCYGHISENCSVATISEETKEKGELIDKTTTSSVVAGEGEYGPWMLVEKRSRRENPDEFKKGNNFNGQRIRELNEGLSVEQLLADRALDPKARSSLKSQNQVEPMTGLVSQAHQASDPKAQKYLKTHKQLEPKLSLVSQMHQANFGSISLDHHCEADHVKADLPSSTQQQVQYIVYFNPTFKESSIVNVVVKDGVLEAKNHSAVVFKKSSSLEPISKGIGGSTGPTDTKSSAKASKGQITNFKYTSSKRG
ncbi:hypothetical protein J1N35_024996 [Gossypium stocksii]|uniref:CCHC-type domain-containing protein n=1 Tax=Gossypium stocksii TaxID=47602 RepID=A0A9D3V6R7_9ROSI|nr:hypothetical protein J1N35_024996 [Gossypium stocksii]